MLRTLPLGEADRLVVAFTDRHGKIRAAARAARRSQRRFAGGLSPGVVGRVELHRGRAGLWRLDGVVPELDHGALGRDLDRFAFATYLCELTDQLVEEQHPEPALFEALAGALATVTQHDASPDALELRRYELALLHHLGHAPGLEHCCVCGGALPPGDVPFAPERGGALCLQHGRGAPTQAESVLQAALALSCGAPVPALDAAQRRRLRDLVFVQLRGLLRAPLRSMELFTQLAAVGAGDAAARVAAAAAVAPTTVPAARGKTGRL